MNTNHLRQHLDRKTEQLGAQSAERLLEARRAALSPQTDPTRKPMWLGPAAASVLLAAIIAWVQPWQSATPTVAEPLANETLITTDDYEILASDDSLELLDELEFLIWLSEQALDNG
ncbi:MAG: hypothetical protein HWE20_11615 [Gammaproteobacteria bacterium]|nr:hypothetical protein [Gammaproteobacteria bacterium]